MLLGIALLVGCSAVALLSWEGNHGHGGGGGREGLSTSHSRGGTERVVRALPALLYWLRAAYGLLALPFVIFKVRSCRPFARYPCLSLCTVVCCSTSAASAVLTGTFACSRLVCSVATPAPGTCAGERAITHARRGLRPQGAHAVLSP